MLRLSHIILLIAVSEINALIKLPNIKPCRPKDAECLKNLFSGLQQNVIEDIPGASLPSVDTLSLPTYNQSNLFLTEGTYDASLSNLQYSGLSNLNISKFEVDLHKLKLILKINFPLIVLSALEVASLNGFGVKMVGEGPIKLEFYNLTIGISLFATKSLEGRNWHLNWKEDLILVSFDKTVYKVEPLFQGSQDFQHFVNEFSLKYPDGLNSEVKRIIKNTLAEFMIQYLNSVHKSYSIEALYLPEIK